MNYLLKKKKNDEDLRIFLEFSLLMIDFLILKS